MATKRKTEIESVDSGYRQRDVRAKLVGIRPLLMHSGQMADPTNKYAKMLKGLTGSGGRGSGTDAKEDAKARIEYEGGLWLDEASLPCIPGEAIEAMIREGGRLRKMGKPLERAIRCPEESYRLRYRGEENIRGVADLMTRYDAWHAKAKTSESVTERDAPALRKRVKMKGSDSSIMRTRPRFFDWSVEFTLSVLCGGKVDLGQVKTALEEAGMMIGLGDWHAKYGLFTVEKFTEV